MVIEVSQIYPTPLPHRELTVTTQCAFLCFWPLFQLAPVTIRPHHERLDEEGDTNLYA